MIKPTKRNFKKNEVKTRKRSIVKSGSKLLENFEKEIIIKFLEMLNAIKLYHWKTYSYATHKATDELYSKLGENTDKFVEVLLGKVQNRANLLDVKSVRLVDVKTPD